MEIKYGKAKINFGKVDGYGCGRKLCKVTLELELRPSDEGPVFSVCGSLWNSSETDIMMGGQCIDSMYDEFGHTIENRELYEEIMTLWEKHHLNDMHAGTKEQEAYVKAWKAENGNKYDYTEVCEYLKSIGMYEVPYNGERYAYGTGWLYREIPEEDLKRIIELIEIYSE